MRSARRFADSGANRGALVVVAVISTVALAACSTDFSPESDVVKLRVLGIRAEPAELRPGETAQLSALVVDPSAPTRKNTLVWLSCDPDPFDLNRSACSDLAALSDTSSLVQSTDGGALALPPGMHLAGFGDHALYQAPADLFSVLDANDPRRKTGTVAQLLLLAIGEEVAPDATREQLDAVFSRVRRKEVASVTAIFRVRVSEADPTQVNHNPVIGDIIVDGVPLPEGAHFTFTPGEDVVMRFTAPESSLERYTQIEPDRIEERTERLIASPYTTGGRFSFDRVAVNEDFDTVYTAPSADQVPPRERGHLWVVVRDTRGGQSWRDHLMHACEGLAEVPAVGRITPTQVSARGGEILVLEGERLDRVLDVFVGPRALLDAGYSPTLKQFRGVMPVLDPGTHAVRVRTVDCVDLDTGLRVNVQ